MSLSAGTLEQGPFVAARRTFDKAGFLVDGGLISYLTRNGGWATDVDRAWKFDTEAAARFSLRSRPGEVLNLAKMAQTKADNGTTGPRDHGLNGLNGAEASPGSMLPAPRSGLVPSGPLEVWESNALADAERTIERGLKTFLEVGAALLGIRDGRLYRATHRSFEEYMQARWGMSARHGHRLVDAAVTTRNLIGNGPQDDGTTGLQTPAEKQAASIVVGRLAPGVLPARQFQIGDVVKTNYGKRHYRIKSIEDGCTCPNYVEQLNFGDEAEKRKPHLHFVVHDVDRRGGEDSYLAGYVYQDGRCVSVDGPHAKGTSGWHKEGNGLDEILLIKDAPVVEAPALAGPSSKLPAPTSESQVRALKGLSAEKQREAWDKATSAAGGKVPTAKQVKEAAGLGGKWPKPNEHGVYDEALAETWAMHDKGKNVRAAIRVLQIGADRWLHATEFQTTETGKSGPLMLQAGQPSPTREAAIFTARATLMRESREAGRSSEAKRTVAGRAAVAKWAADASRFMVGGKKGATDVTDSTDGKQPGARLTEILRACEAARDSLGRLTKKVDVTDTPLLDLITEADGCLSQVQNKTEVKLHRLQAKRKGGGK